MTKKKLCIVLSVVAVVITLTVVTMVKDDVFKTEYVASNQETNLKSYKSEFKGVVRAVEPDVNRMYIRDVDCSLDSEYEYKNSLSLKDMHGNEITYSQIKIGDMYKIKYELVDDIRVIKEMKLCQGIWEYSDISGVYYDGEKLEVGDEEFDVDISTVVIDGLGLISLDSISQDDIVDVKGIGKKVYCVVITKKHGLIKLANYKSYIGGTIEVGLGKREKIVEDMEISCKEGKYDIVLKKGSHVIQKNVKIKGGDVCIVDVSKTNETKQAEVTFNIVPMDALIYINGTKYSYEQLQSVIMPYGTYDIIVARDGYKTYTSKITINKEKQDVLITLEQNEVSVIKGDNDSTKNTNTDNSGNSDTNNSNMTDNEDNVNEIDEAQAVG